MAISGISSVTTIAPQATTPAKAESTNTATSDKSSATSASATDKSSSAATSAPAATVLTQGSSAAHGHHKKHAVQGQPGHQVSKSA